MSEASMKLKLSSWLRRAPAPLLGIDIGTASVRLVELAPVGKLGLRLECCATERLPNGAVSDGHIEQMELLVQALQQVWKNSGTRTRNVALCMPSASVISKKILLPAGLLEAELEAHIEAEAAQYLPFALDDMSLDFAVIGAAPDTPDEVEVMLAATRRDKVEQRVALVAAAGLTARVIDIESHAARAALARVIQLQQSAQPAAGRHKLVALCQIGAATLHFSVMQDGRLMHESESALGGKLLAQQLVHAAQMTIEEAEVRSADLPDAYRKDLLQPFMDSVALEVGRAIEVFTISAITNHVKANTKHDQRYDKHDDKQHDIQHPPGLDALYLAGAYALIPGLPQLLSERCHLPCAMAAPFEGMHLASALASACKPLQSEGAAFLVACGLALRRFG